MAKTPSELKRPDPAYRLYTSDFLVRTHNMTDEQVGKYIRILCFEHQNGHLQESDLLSFCKGRDELVFSKFVQDESGLYYNEEMEKEVKRRTGIREGNSDNAYKRWGRTKNQLEGLNSFPYPDDLSQ
jgi:uncharacterized protein YdaU (DUF1376 family)